MAGSGLLSAQDHVVVLDYGQFYLRTYRGPNADPDADLPEIVEIVEIVGQAINAEGIAQSPDTLVVLSPHQNNFEMPLRVEVWDAPPPDDTAEWPEAFEAHLDVRDGGLAYESPTADFTPLEVPPGAYYALITGRGFVARGWPGSTTPGDSWRIRLWPSAGPQAPRRLSSWPGPGG
jgi:hypothetical protein